MANDKIIDVTGGLKKESIVKKGAAIGSKMTIDIQVTKPVHVDLDPKTYVAQFAKAIEETVQHNLLNGLKPNGLPLPAVSPATQERRRYRVEQHSRGGYPKTGGRVKKWKDVTKAKKNLDKRYRAKSGVLVAKGPFVPIPGAPNAAVESGMLAKSFVVIPKGESVDTYTMTGYFADARSVMDKHGSSPVQRAARTGALDFTNVAQQPALQTSLQRTVDNAISNDEKLLQAEQRKLLQQLNALLGQIGSLGG